MFINSLITSVLSNFQFILSMLVVVIVAACFLGRYVVLTKKLVLSSLGVLILTILANIILAVFVKGEVIADMLVLIEQMINIAIFTYAFFFYLFAFKEKRVLRAIESTVCLYLLTAYISTFSQLAVVYFAGGTDEIFTEIYVEQFATSDLWTAISGLSFLFTLALFVVGYFGFYRQKKYYVIGIPSRILFIIWIVIFIIFPYIPAAMSGDDFTLDERYGIMSFMFGIGLVILGLAAPVIVVIASAERSMREKNKSQEAYLAAELDYIEQYKRKQTETRAFRHDVKNNLAMTSMMLEEGHVDEAREHIQNMLGKVSALSPQYVSGDEILDIIISMKADRMNELGVRFTLDGVVDGGLNIKPMDKCSIFANALDNAIEAASACEDPYVSFEIKRTDKFFVLKITNSASKKVDIGKLLSSSGYTSKKDKDHHGFGLMNVRRTIEDCNGMLKAESDDGSFTLVIMLPRLSPNRSSIPSPSDEK